MHFSHSLIEHWGRNAKIALLAAQDLDIDAEILAPDRLSLHSPSVTWDWKDYPHHSVELLV